MAKETIPIKTSFTKWALGLSFGLIAAIGALFGVDTYVENKIGRVIQDEKIIKKLQSYVRPSIIFDQHGTILSDQGAWQFIDDLKVSIDKKGFVNSITVALKNPSSTPILTSLDGTVQYSISKVRGKKLDVIFELEMRSYSEPKATSSLFSLEMVYGELLQFNPKSNVKEKVIYFPGKIVAEGMDTIRHPGNARFNASMKEDPIYNPVDGDTYYDLRKHCYLVFSNGKWKKLSFVDED